MLKKTPTKKRAAGVTPAADNDKMYVTSRELAQMFHVGAGEITSWKLPVHSMKGKTHAKVYFLPDAIPIILSLKFPSNSGTFDKEEELARKAHHDANLAEMKEARERKELIGVHLAADYIGRVMNALSNKFSSFPSQVSSRYAELPPELIEDFRLYIEELKAEIRDNAIPPDILETTSSED